MSRQDFPDDLIVTIEDFKKCGWKKALSAAAINEGYPGMRQTFSDAAEQAMKSNKAAEGKVLWLLAAACSMMLSPHSPNEPFKPFLEFGDRPSPKISLMRTYVFSPR